MTDNLIQELISKGQLVTDYLLQYLSKAKVEPDYLREGIVFYIKKGGKRLRPAVTFWACALAGGDPSIALPAASAIELMHTCTLVHDDIIDRDDLRRNSPSMHAYFQKYFAGQIAPGTLEHFAQSIAMLVGDIQFALAVSMMNESPLVDKEVVRWLVHNLTFNWVPEVWSGETLDVQYIWQPWDKVDEQMVLRMLDKKTASTFALAGKTGVLIGLNKLALDHPLIKNIEVLCRNAGLAFQLQDDILGVIGDQAELGKPVGSDIREGKKTVLVTYAYAKADAAQKKTLRKLLGKNDATPGEIEEVKQLLINLGAVAYTKQLAEHYAGLARKTLDNLPDHPVKSYFKDWITFIIERSY